MQTHQLHVSNGRDKVLDIRSELFVFSEVLEVFVTGRPDVLVVVCSGHPHPAQWLRALRAAGYETLASRAAGGNPLNRNGSQATGAGPGDSELHRRRAEADAGIALGQAA